MRAKDIISTYVRQSNSSYYFIDKTLKQGRGTSSSNARSNNPRIESIIRTLEILGYRLAIIDSSNNIKDIIEPSDN